MLDIPESAWVARRFKAKDGTITCTKWLSPSDWAKQHKTKPNYRSVLPNEIVLETDFPAKEINWLVAQKIMGLLRQQGYGYKCLFSGNKSFHVHLFFNAELSPKCKKLWIGATLGEVLAADIDESNCGKKHLIGIENTPHPKTGACKTLVCEHGNWQANTMPKKIIEAACKEPEKTFSKNHTVSATKNCPFLNYCLENKIDLQNRQQNSNFSPNVFAYFKGNEKLLQQLVETQQQENITLARLNCWKQYRPEFNCKQVQKFAGSINKRAICDLCLLEASNNGQSFM